MSGGGNGSTTTTQTQSLPPWLTGAAQDYLGAAGQVAQLPYTPYTGQRVADLSPLQQQSIQNIGDLSTGTPSMYAGEQMLTDTLSGNYLNGNPAARNQVSSGGQYQFSPLSSGGQYNPAQIGSGGQYGFDPLSGGFNPYMGDSPYFQQSLDKGLNDITRAYQQGTAAQTDKMFAQAHAFGGSAHQEAMQNNERQLGDTLNNYVNQARQGQYDRSANLAESGLGRSLQAGQFNANLGNQAFESAANRGLQAGQLNNQFGQSAFENAANRGLQAGQFNNSLGNQAFESAAQRGLNAGQFNANLGSQAYENERNRQMGAVGASTGLYTAGMQGLGNALQAGGIERSQNQDLLSSQYQDFTDWRNYPDSRIGLFGNALGSVTGAAPRETTTNQGLPPTDRVSQGLGIYALGNALNRGSSK